MTQDQAVARFGEKIGKAIPMDSAREPETSDDEMRVTDYLQRADAYEIWAIEDKTVYWINKGYPDLLDKKKVHLGLKGFCPSTRPMFATLTTSMALPTPDFLI